MYPPVGIGQVRVSASHDITLADRLHLPAGTCIWVPHHAIQNVSFNWDDHDKFKPGVLSFCGLALCNLCKAQDGWQCCPVGILPMCCNLLRFSHMLGNLRQSCSPSHTRSELLHPGSGNAWKGILPE